MTKRISICPPPDLGKRAAPYLQGIPSNRMRARRGNGLWHTFTSEAWNNATGTSKWLGHTVTAAARQVWKRLGAYLHIGSMELAKKFQNGSPRLRQTGRAIPSYLHT